VLQTEAERRDKTLRRDASEPEHKGFTNPSRKGGTPASTRSDAIVGNQAAGVGIRGMQWDVTECIQLDGLDSLRGVRACRLEGVLVVRFELFFADHALHLP
jgi:hypothetical protein